ncbi:Dps family protein [Mariniflexile gromovii]|uniref:DNA starvation/stationary phase protection protein n=1 Tax=Mariniflexile gromovii TaxID=362523 RepID=A0ABS4BUR8_9FLAO|nr:Dps family protein [Mariniflexile gromovii]MBP0904312.1 DNA starvation/stationary phase protection protein [Mariniflexile gromovii]
MKSLNSIGLDTEKSKKLTDLLGDLLSNYSIFYQNARGYHWNIHGDDFFVLHQKFEELYNNLLVKIDEIAERILTLGNKPSHQFSKYLMDSNIKESSQVSNGQKSIEEIIKSLDTLLVKQRLILKTSEDADDSGTNALMSDYIREQEKLVWMYSAYLKV